MLAQKSVLDALSPVPAQPVPDGVGGPVVEPTTPTAPTVAPQIGAGPESDAEAEVDPHAGHQVVRLDLEAPLEGHYVGVDADLIDMDALEGLEGSSIRGMLDTAARVLCYGNLPHGITRAGLGRLTPDCFGAVGRAIVQTTRLPKAPKTASSNGLPG